MYPCPCCGYLQYSAPSGSFEICQICFWEDDDTQLMYPDLEAGANGCSLLEAQRNFIEFGACHRANLDSVERPTADDVRDPQWRPINATQDRYLRWENADDKVVADKVRRRHRDEWMCLNYWEPNYWLKGEPW